MRENAKQGRAVVLLTLFLATALLGACGNSNKKSTSPATAPSQADASAVGMSTCTTCHTVVTADWLTSRHANLDPGGLYSPGVPSLSQIAGCTAACHDPGSDSGRLVAGYAGNVPRPVIGCEACHGGGSLHNGSGPISLLSGTFVSSLVGTVPVSGQFVMCTNCHGLLASSGTTTAATTHDPLSGVTPTGNQYTITDTHFATPGDWSGIGTASTTSITGYSTSYRDAQGNYRTDYSDERVCVNCHNPHKPATQNREWAQSAHGDKGAFNQNLTETGYFSGAWAHYNWSVSTFMACQRCHTTTGFAAYADALRSGDTARAQMLREGTNTSAAVVPFSAQFKPEMLKCNGCHTDNIGTLRNPGPITANYDYVSGVNTYARASHAYPDIYGSNVCMSCHTGRENGDTIKGLNDPALLSSGTITSFDFKNNAFISSHYLTAGGQVFTVTGYTFDGRAYNNLPEYRHDKIGTPATLNTGSNGPCIGCHMSRPNKNGDHLFLPVSRSTITYGEITGIASGVCLNCHGPSTTLILDMVKEQQIQFTESLEALKDQLKTKLKFFFAPYYPYFFAADYDPAYVEATAGVHCSKNLPIKNWQTGGTSTFSWSGTSCVSSVGVEGIAGTGQNSMGAAFNFNLLEHDPGAFAHNRMYTKRLIYDSIDWADDGAMNYSVGTTLCSECDLSCFGSGVDARTWCAEAMTYLLPNGVLWDGVYPAGNGIEAERP